MSGTTPQVLREGEAVGVSVLDRPAPVPLRRELPETRWKGALPVLRLVARCAGWALVLGVVAVWIAVALHDAPA